MHINHTYKHTNIQTTTTGNAQEEDDTFSALYDFDGYLSDNSNIIDVATTGLTAETEEKEPEVQRKGEKVYCTVLDSEGKMQQVEVLQCYLSSKATYYNSFIAALRAWVHHTIFPNTKFIDSRDFIHNEAVNVKLKNLLNCDELTVLRYKCDIASKVMVTMNAKRQYIYRKMKKAFTAVNRKNGKYKCLCLEMLACLFVVQPKTVSLHCTATL